MYDLLCCVLALPIGYAAVGTSTHHGRLGQMCFRSADRHDVRLCQIFFRAADRSYIALVDTTVSSSSVFAFLLGVDTRLCLRELVLLIAADIQMSQISFRFADRGDLPSWSTRLWRLEGPSLCCFVDIRLGWVYFSLTIRV